MKQQRDRRAKQTKKEVTKFYPGYLDKDTLW